MKDQIKLVVGVRLVQCTRIVEGKYTFLRADKDLGDARYMGYDYTPEGNALASGRRKVHWKHFWRCATSFVEPLVIK